MKRMLFITTPMAVALTIFFLACSDDKPTEPSGPKLPTVTTSPINSITQLAAQCGGNITSDGGASITVRGVCWSTNPTPTIADNITTDGVGIGSFTSYMTGLTSATLYYVRAYARSTAGIGYGNALTFTTSSTALPTISTNSITGITQKKATCGATLTSDGGDAIVSIGFCWSQSPNPTINDNVVYNYVSETDFFNTITGLNPNTLYYIRAYATNSIGTGYGASKSFTTGTTATMAIDIDGNMYETVQIGTQLWMAENLRVTHYRNGEMILDLNANTDWWLQIVSGGFCNYNNSQNTAVKLGNYFNGYAVFDSRNIAPTGWHIPSDAEWQTLINYLGGDSLASEKMRFYKDTALSWVFQWESGTNESGFGARAAGFRREDVYTIGISDVGAGAYFWTSTPYASDSSTIWYRAVWNHPATGYQLVGGLHMGASVRCVKD